MYVLGFVHYTNGALKEWAISRFYTEKWRLLGN